jgi:hypothetical protein
LDHKNFRIEGENMRMLNRVRFAVLLVSPLLLLAAGRVAVAADLRVTTADLSSGLAGFPYDQGLAATGGTGLGYTWSVVAGNLPAGLSLSNSTISGSPTATGNFPVTVQVRDSAGATAQKPFDIAVYGNTSHALAWNTSYDSGFYYDCSSPPQQWNRADSVAGLARDRAGNLYVAGNSQRNAADRTCGPYAYQVWTTIKYTADGTQQWVRTYDNRGSELGRVEGICADAAGNSYIVGTVFTQSPNPEQGNGVLVRKYDTNGNVMWSSAPYPYGNLDLGRAIACKDNFLYLAVQRRTTESGHGDYDMLVYVLDPSSGAVLSQCAYNHESNSDVPYGIAVDDAMPTPNVYLAGSTEVSPGVVDFLTVKLAPSFSSPLPPAAPPACSAVAWARTHDHAGNVDSAHGVAIDLAGNAYVTGVTRCPYIGCNSNILSVKYDRAGNPGGGAWPRIFDLGGDDEGSGVQVDLLGRILVTGHATVPSNAYSSDALTLTYSSEGSPLGYMLFGSVGGDRAKGIVVDGESNVFVAGTQERQYSFVDFMLLKYSSTGN